MPGFNNPWWLLCLIGIPVLYWLYLRGERRKKSDALLFSRVSMARAASEDTTGWWKKRQKILFILSLLAIGLLIVGLADPHIPLDQTKEGANVVLALDISGSMNAADYPPSRLESAKSAAKVLLGQLDRKDNAGIVVFESAATTAAYLTPDKERVISRLDAIRARGGPTALGDGLALAADMASSLPNQKKVVILLSDGVSNAGMVSPEVAAKYALNNNVQVYVVGIGSNNPVVTGSDQAGDVSLVPIDEVTLNMIARETGGSYFRSVDSSTLHDIYSNLNNEIVREKEETSLKDLFIGGGIIVLLAGLYLRYWRLRIIP
jgi:Ca-activated chloride channel homolog